MQKLFTHLLVIDNVINSHNNFISNSILLSKYYGQSARACKGATWGPDGL